MNNTYYTFGTYVLSDVSTKPLSLEQTVQWLVQVVWQQEDRLRKLEYKLTMQEEFEQDHDHD